MAENCKFDVKFIQECVKYTETSFSQKNVYKWGKLLKEDQNSIQDEDKPYRPTIVRTPEMVDSVNVLIWADRGVTIEDIPEQLGISVSTEYKIVHDDLLF